jgi:hypothetical protein
MEGVVHLLLLLPFSCSFNFLLLIIYFALLESRSNQELLHQGLVNATLCGGPHPQVGVAHNSKGFDATRRRWKIGLEVHVREKVQT